MATSSVAEMAEVPDPKALDYIINHVFLPPHLPQGDDADAGHTNATIRALRNSVACFLSAEPGSAPSVRPAFEMLDRFLKMDSGGVDKTRQTRGVRDVITDLKNGDIALLHLHAQNAGLLLTARQNDILIEAFELLAPNDRVMPCQGALLREFPDRAAIIPYTRLQDPDFLNELVTLIQTLTTGVASVARPKVKKGKTIQPEERDTVSPLLVTGMLMDIFAGLGEGVASEGRVTKRSREHVGWNDARLPFHRCATWLLLRVALRLVLGRAAAGTGEASWYKPLMAYHIARLLVMAARADEPEVPSDRLFAMQAKVVRRVVKLDPAEETGWVTQVGGAVELAQRVMEERWRTVRDLDTKHLPLDKLASLSFDQDTALKIPRFRKHLAWIKSRSAGASEPMGPGDTTHFTPLRHSELPNLDTVSLDAAMNRPELLSFEAWVELSLPAWVKDQLCLAVEACVFDLDALIAVAELRNLIRVYRTRATKAYEGIPEALSVMYLVLMELWVAMDRIAGHALPLLLDYDPGFPFEMLHPLLLERKEDMKRLKTIEDYLSHRQSSAPREYLSAFGGFGRKKSFAVRFYQTSAEHQKLLQQIVAKATEQKAQKLQEYDEKRAQHEALAQAHRGYSTCEQEWDQWEELWGHSSACNRCRLKREMDDISIRVFEWPLPTRPSHAQAVVVEIRIPQLVEIWREVTWDLVTDVFRDETGDARGRGREDNLYFAKGHSGLRGWSEATSHLHPASTVKPMEVAHYGRGTHILEATPDNICVPHQAEYSYYDEPTRCLALGQIAGACLPRHCSYAELVKGQPVEDWVRYARHTSNDVIADQHRCPLDIALEEFRAFGNVRAGVPLQWANICCELVMPAIDFNKKSTFALVMQACLEAGPDGGDDVGSLWRAAHGDTQEEVFMTQMLQALDEALERIRASWQNDVALCLLTCLTTRLLSVSPSTEISDRLLQYLAKLRAASITWARQLLDKLNASTEHADRQEWAQRVRMAALICAATFNVGEDHVALVLSSSHELSVFVEAAVLARNHLPPSGRRSDPIALQLMHRWHLVMYRACNSVANEARDMSHTGLDEAITRLWAEYSPPSAFWTQRTLESQRHILERGAVSFNLLTGHLFVNGYPLRNLPPAYQQDETFRELFGEQILDVVPSSVPGMEFSACRDQNGWLVHFAMKDGQLVVHTVRRRPLDNSVHDETEWEYITRDNFRRDLPDSFVFRYAHWLNLSTDEVEFRPFDQKWESSPENWYLTRVSGKEVLRKGSRFVIDPSSPAGELVHEILGSIAPLLDIDPIFDVKARCLAVELSWMDLCFSVQEGEAILKSKNYTGMQVDGTQGIGALIGLSNKLVLKPSTGAGFRTILVPRGDISISRTKSHPHVHLSIPYKNYREVIRHNAFTVNDTLGQLTDAGSLQGKLRLCYLHALTSYCLPDPLTHRTGTEEALRILRGAAVKSYPALDDDSRKLLEEIAALSPRRAYYPEHLRCMERAQWDNHLPALSQHDDFWPVAKDVYDHYATAEKLFRPAGGDGKTPSVPEIFAEDEKSRSLVLAERARIRNAVFRVSEFGAEEHTTAWDRWYYPSEHRKNNGSAVARGWVAQLAKCVDTGDQRLLFRPSTNLRKVISAANGTRFRGLESASLAFKLPNFEPLSESIEGRWCGVHRALVEEKNKYRKIHFLSSLLYAEESDRELVQALMALGTMSVFSQEDMLPPEGCQATLELNGECFDLGTTDDSFNLEISRSTLPSDLLRIVHSGAKLLQECPEWDWERRSWESPRDLQSRRDKAWSFNRNDMTGKFVSALRTQIESSWAIERPTGHDYHSYLNVKTIMSKAREEVKMAQKTEAFHYYLDSVTRYLAQAEIAQSITLTVPPTLGTTRPASRPGFIAAMSLFSQPAPPSHPPRLELFPELCAESQGLEQSHARLSILVDELETSNDLQDHQTSYLKELRHSMDSRPPPRRRMVVQPDNPTIQPTLEQHLRTTTTAHTTITTHITHAVTGPSLAHQLSKTAALYPRLSPIFFLQRLTRTFWPTIPPRWRQSLINLALTLIHLQRAARLASHARDLPARWSDLSRELSNPGDHGNPAWDPLVYPEGLLLEIEQGILIRPVQNDIAAQMRSPPGGENAVMQLNMGEGKSTVIVPLVAAALGDGKRVVRVVVAKPQASQMTHMLVGRLGGLVDRRVFYLPFSRSVQPTREDVTTLRGIIEKCKEEGGAFLVQPEHLLSFKLMGIDKSGSDGGGEGSLGREITRLYKDFEAVSRDIVDESDENFSVKFELIYTMGSQEAVEMSPDRWILIQELLRMTEDVVRGLVKAEEPGSAVSEGLLLEDEKSPRRVPKIRVLEESGGQQLIAALANKVCDVGITGLSVLHHTPDMRQAVLNYILLERPAKADIDMVQNGETGLFSTSTTKSALLLLRGLLAKGVLLFALGQKRYRVNYGLAPDRRPPTMLAVPYRAKDMPSARSEFSHPDVVIVLTCLSYYYGGLSHAELYTCLELLSKSDQSEEEYARWADKSPALPLSFRHFSAINLKDRPQCEVEVFPALKYSRPVVDFYLRMVVFPREVKQFPFKLSASGWDLARCKEQPLTGFSGTNDSKGVLPLSIKALDLQPHTNASVLSTLLQEENMVLELGDGGASQLTALTEGMLLAALKSSDPEMRVVLDVGAQIIESSNFNMAKRLLKNAPASSTEAAIFFNDHDELSVLTRNDVVDSFLTSPFAAHTDRCLVFLDQAHTRGTDLKLPDNYRAAVTLGPGVTKDTLVQACMRMRKLGQGQSVTFIVSPEMQKRIRSLRNITDGRPLAVPDVLAWAISEAWDEAVRSVPLWATQGVRHLRQETVWQETDTTGGFTTSSVQAYLEPDAMSLEQRYIPVPATTHETEITTLMANLNLATDPSPGDTDLAAIRAKLHAFTHSTRASSSSSPTLQEEQERELAPEIEQERQVSRPPPRKALPHSLHADVDHLARTGVLLPSSPAFLPAFDTLSTTSADPLFLADLSTFPAALLVTRDFAQTVDASTANATNPYRSDDYQRPVQWLLLTRPSQAQPRKMVIISPHEAALLKPLLASRASPVSLHAYHPRLTLSHRTMEHLNTYTIPFRAPTRPSPPDELVTQLNLFAGQLYLRSYDEYVRMCEYLGLSYTKNKGEERVGQDGFVGRGVMYPDCEFETSPVGFLRGVVGVRRDCVGVERTHMGRVLVGGVLGRGDFQGAEGGGEGEEKEEEEKKEDEEIKQEREE